MFYILVETKFKIMSVRILEDKDQGYRCLYCSTTMVVFGEIFYEDDDIEAFLDWLALDARMYTQNELSMKLSKFRNLVYYEGKI